MNILESIQFNPHKPGVLNIKKNESIRLFCVALCKDQILPKHKANVPSLLLVLKGRINFLLEGEKICLQELQTYEIPVNKDHEVKGLTDENVFLITQELK